MFSKLVQRRLSTLCSHLQKHHFSSNIRTVALIPGDGIGPEISDAVQKIFVAADVIIAVFIIFYISKTSKYE